MKILKNVLLVLAGIIVILAIIGLFSKKDIAVEKEITINKPKADVFNYVKMIKNQDNYSVWNMRDPNMKKDYAGTDGTVGFIAKWNSEISGVGEGEQEIMAITEGERMDMQLRFVRPFKAKDEAYMITEPVSDTQTKVRWGFKGKMDYPKNIMLLFMDMEKMLGEQLQTGLENLKTQVEK